MYFPVSFSRNFSAARRRAISFWRSVSWGAAGSGSVAALGPQSYAPAAGARPRARRRRGERRRLADEREQGYPPTAQCHGGGTMPRQPVSRVARMPGKPGSVERRAGMPFKIREYAQGCVDSVVGLGAAEV